MKRFFLLILLFPSLVFAEITPSRGQDDPRIRTVDYNPKNVVRVSTFYGVSTHIQFDPDETIRDVAVGDDRAWTIIARNAHLFIKPRDRQANTNVTVVTDRRVYQFVLVVNRRSLKDKTAWSDPNLIFSLSFRYPEDEAGRKTKQDERHQIARHLEYAVNPEKKRPANHDYWVAGSESVSPSEAWDDGRFIYLVFSNNRDMPAVYAVDENGGEALINTHVINGNTIVIQRMEKQLMLRKGMAVASLLNKSFDTDKGLDNKTGTISGQVRRVIRGASQ